MCMYGGLFPFTLLIAPHATVNMCMCVNECCSIKIIVDLFSLVSHPLP